MAKLNEVVEKKPLFEGYEQTSKDDKKVMAEKENGTEMEILAYANLSNDKDSYGVVLYRIGTDVKTMTISSIQIESLDSAIEKIGEDEARSNKTEKFFSEPVEVTLKSVPSKANPKFSYYVFE